MQASNEPALSPAMGKRAMSFDALEMRKNRHIGQSLPAASIGHRVHVTAT